MLITAAQCRAARALIKWSQTDLSGASKVARATLAGFEAEKRVPFERTQFDIRRAFEQAGVIFIDQNGGGPGVRLRDPLP